MENTDVPENLPGLNLKEGIDRIGGNRESYKRVLLKFATHNQNAISQMKTAFALNDSEAVRMVAHTLAGVSGNIGANDLSRAAKLLETAIRDNRRGEWNPLLIEVDASLSLVLASIRSVMPGNFQIDDGTPGDDVIDTEKAASLVNELKKAIEDNNAKSMGIFIALKTVLGGSEFSAGLDAVEKRLDEYDFDGALDALRVLSAAIIQ
jgi:two-component system sensor histidine kinase/response regulator